MFLRRVCVSVYRMEEQENKLENEKIKREIEI